MERPQLPQLAGGAPFHAAYAALREQHLHLLEPSSEVHALAGSGLASVGGPHAPAEPLSMNACHLGAWAGQLMVSRS
jgi:hypothetical protein